MPPEIVFSLHNISKFYGEKLIFRNLNMTAEAGTIHLVLGANGAGKSTLLRLVAGLTRPDSGTISFRDGIRTAYIGHATFLYPALTALQNLRFWARVYRLPQEEPMNYLARTGLEAHAHEPVRVFSRGMRQRLNFARCLMLNPDLFLLDEPFTGMDEESQSQMRAELKKKAGEGACILVVSHSPHEDGTMADHAVMIADKRLSNANMKPC